MEKSKKGRTGQSILCCNDGETFSSVHQAAKYYDISVSAITRQLKKERKTAAGLYFVEVSGNETDVEIQTIRKNILSTVYKMRRYILK